MLMVLRMRGVSLVELLVVLALITAGVVAAGASEVRLLSGVRATLEADAALRAHGALTANCTNITTWIGEVTKCGKELRID